MKQKQLVYLMTIVFGVILVLPLLEYNLSLLNNSAIIIDPINNIPLTDQNPNTISERLEDAEFYYESDSPNIEIDSSSYSETITPVWSHNDGISQDKYIEFGAGSFTSFSDSYKFDSVTFSTSGDEQYAPTFDERYFYGIDDSTEVGGNDNWDYWEWEEEVDFSMGAEWSRNWGEPPFDHPVVGHEHMFANQDFADPGSLYNDMFFLRRTCRGIKMASEIRSVYTYSYTDTSKPSQPYINIDEDTAADNDALTYSFQITLSAMGIYDDNTGIPQRWLYRPPLAYRIFLYDEGGNSIEIGDEGDFDHNGEGYNIISQNMEYNGVEINIETDRRTGGYLDPEYDEDHYLEIDFKDYGAGWQDYLFTLGEPDTWAWLGNQKFAVNIFTKQRIEEVHVNFMPDQDDDWGADDNIFGFGTPKLTVTGDCYEIKDTDNVDRYFHDTPSLLDFQEGFCTDTTLIWPSGSEPESMSASDGTPLDEIIFDDSDTYFVRTYEQYENVDDEDPIETGSSSEPLSKNYAKTTFTINPQHNFIVPVDKRPSYRFELMDHPDPPDIENGIDYILPYEVSSVSNYFNQIFTQTEYHYIESDGSHYGLLWGFEGWVNKFETYDITIGTSTYSGYHTIDYVDIYIDTGYDLKATFNTISASLIVHNGDPTVGEVIPQGDIDVYIPTLTMDPDNNGLRMQFDYDCSAVDPPALYYDLFLDFDQAIIELIQANQVITTLNPSERYVKVPAYQGGLQNGEHNDDPYLQFVTVEDDYSDTASVWYSSVDQYDEILNYNEFSVTSSENYEKDLFYNMEGYFDTRTQLGRQYFSLYTHNPSTQTQLYIDQATMLSYEYNPDTYIELTGFPDDENYPFDASLSFDIPNSIGQYASNHYLSYHHFQYGDSGTGDDGYKVYFTDDRSPSGNPLYYIEDGSEDPVVWLESVAFQSPIFNADMLDDEDIEDVNEIHFNLASDPSLSGQEFRIKSLKMVPRGFEEIDGDIHFIHSDPSPSNIFVFDGESSATWSNYPDTLSIDNIPQHRSLLFDILINFELSCTEYGDIEFGTELEPLRIETPIVFVDNGILIGRQTGQVPITHGYDTENVMTSPYDHTYSSITVDEHEFILALIQDENLIQTSRLFSSAYLELPDLVDFESYVGSLLWEDTSAKELTLKLSSNTQNYIPKLTIWFDDMAPTEYEMIEIAGVTDGWTTNEDFDPADYPNADDIDVQVRLYRDDGVTWVYNYPKRQLMIDYFITNTYDSNNLGVTWSQTYDNTEVVFQLDTGSTQYSSTNAEAQMTFDVSV